MESRRFTSKARAAGADSDRQLRRDGEQRGFPDAGFVLRPLLYGIGYLLSRHVLRRQTPLICGLVLTNECNLHCRHCRVASRGRKRLSFRECMTVIDSFYDEGGRSLYLEGGEPFLWRDRHHRLNDIVVYAHRSGYQTVVVYTNGMFPIETSANTVFVSIDGLRRTHDYLRGPSFDRIMVNIRASQHPSIHVNYTINNHNKDEIEEFCDFVDEVDEIRDVFFYFHTPYYGCDELYIGPDERKEILRSLIELSKKHSILNSRAGLECALRNDWHRPLDICQVYEKGKTYKCCRFSGDPELCRNCGYLSYAETHQTLSLRPSAVRKALEYF